METPTPRVSCILLVTGSRSIHDEAFVFKYLDAHVKQHGRPTKLIHGGAAGVDMLAGAWAEARSIPVDVHLIDQKYLREKGCAAAYTKRDQQMVKAADLVVSIWDGHSPGTLKTKEYARYKGKLRNEIVFTKAT